jgi:hypothetical protein
MDKKKKIIKIMVIFIFFCLKTFADTLSEDLQFLTITTACIGRYNSGHISATIKDPVDWYEPPDLRDFMTSLADTGTRTDTFYGVCFDYAEDMYKLIRKFRSELENEGMAIGQWYIATDYTKSENRGKIEIYDLANESNYTSKLNNTYVKFVKTINAKPHGENHAWIVVQRTNGQWMWFDPTWTDNSGDVIWGYIENGEEQEYWAEDQFIFNTTILEDKHRSTNQRVSPPVTAIPSAPSAPRQPPSYNGNNSSQSASSSSSWQPFYLELGYNYTLGMPVGFTIGTIGFYTSWNFVITEDNGYSGGIFDDYNYNPENGTVDYLWYDFIDQGHRRYQEFEWTIGYTMNLINEFLMMPIGIGGNHTRELRLFEKWDSDLGSDGKMWIPPRTGWTSKLVLEAGLQMVLGKIFYISATYRLIGFERSSFTLGSGIIFF